MRSTHTCRIPFAMNESATRGKGRPASPVPATTPGGRLRQLRKGAKMSQDELGVELLIDRSMVSKYESGEHPIPPGVLDRAGQLFGKTPAFILYGDTFTRMARVDGYVGAGTRVEALAEGAPKFVEVPGTWFDAVAFEIKGDSCYPIYEEGDIIVVRGSPRINPGEFEQKMCVVETEDGIGLVKRVIPVGDNRYNLESPNAPMILDVALTSARPVKSKIT